jgi:tetratricopeptide (TPR) repeat protein
MLGGRFQFRKSGSPNKWEALRALLPCVQAWCDVVTVGSDYDATSQNIGLLLVMGDVFQNINGDAKSACSTFRSAHQWTEEAQEKNIIPKDDPLIPTCKLKLASSYSALASPMVLHGGSALRHEKALVLRKEALKLRKRFLPKGHLAIAAAMKDVAWSYSDLGQHEDALMLRKEHLECLRRKPKKRDPSIAHSMAYLASSHSLMATIQHDPLTAAVQHEKALKLREESHAILVRVLPQIDPRIATSMSDLATACSNVGQHQKALQLREETLKLREILWKDHPYHPHITSSRRNLAQSYFELGRHAEARELQTMVIAHNKKVLPEGHPHIMKAMDDLARTCSQLRQHAETSELSKTASVLEVVEVKKLRVL